jgi:LacI family transcriptional regulator
MKKTFKVILLIESSRASGREYLRGSARYAHVHGAWSFYWEPSGFEITRQTLEQLDVDGIILRDVGRRKTQVLHSRIPAVVLGHRDREVRGLVNVVTDSDAIGHIAAEHLRQCGFKHFAYCGLARGPLEQTPWSKLRMESFGRNLFTAAFSMSAR